MHSRLLTDIVDERLATDLVERLQDIVDVLYDVLVVAHGASSLRCVCEPNNHSVTAVMECVVLDLSASVSLAAFTKLVTLPT